MSSLLNYELSPNASSPTSLSTMQVPQPVCQLQTTNLSNYELIKLPTRRTTSYEPTPPKHASPSFIQPTPPSLLLTKRAFIANLT